MPIAQVQTVVVMGQGYVGLPLAMRAVEAGYDVVGYDPDGAKASGLAAGRSHVEDIDDERLGAALATGRYRPSADTADLAGFDLAVISVPTPLRDGLPDLTYIEGAADVLAPYLEEGATVVLESTTYPGTTEDVVGPRLATASGLTPGTDFHLGYSPERIDPGNETWTFETTPKVVSGIDEASLGIIADFYGRLVAEVVPTSGTREAELAKLLENTFRHVNIALVNELAVLATELGVDVWDAIDAASTKPFGFMRFTPGPGVGGHCLPIDPSYLSWQVRRSLGRPFRFIELANDVNEHMPDYVVQRVMLGLNQQGTAVRGARILLLGLAYKANTADARESPSTRVAELLADLGADLHAADPHVAADHRPGGVKRVEATPEDVANADAVVLLVDHDAFSADLVTQARYVLDCQRVLPASPNVEVL